MAAIWSHPTLSITFKVDDSGCPVGERVGEEESRGRVFQEILTKLLINRDISLRVGLEPPQPPGPALPFRLGSCWESHIWPQASFTS